MKKETTGERMLRLTTEMTNALEEVVLAQKKFDTDPLTKESVGMLQSAYVNFWGSKMDFEIEQIKQVVAVSVDSILSKK